MSDGLDMLLEKLEHLIEALHKSLSQTTAHRHHLYPLLLLLKLVYIPFPSKDSRNRSTITTIIFFI